MVCVRVCWCFISMAEMYAGRSEQAEERGGKQGKLGQLMSRYKESTKNLVHLVKFLSAQCAFD